MQSVEFFVLKMVSYDLDLNVDVITDRIEKVNLPPQNIISARALASLEQLLEYSERFSNNFTICCFPKGKTFQDELTKASEKWHIDYNVIPSIIPDGSVILKINSFSRK